MASGPSQQFDLQALAAKANTRLERQQAVHEAALAGGGRSDYLRRFGPPLALAIAVVLFLSNLPALKASAGWVSEASRDSDLNLVLESARKAVEENRRINGELPPRVPLPALDALVALQTTASGYRLATQMNGRVAVMDEGGTVTIQRLN